MAPPPLFRGRDSNRGDAFPGEHIELDVDDPRTVERRAGKI